MLKRLRSAHPMLYCLVAEVLFLGMLFVASLLSLLLILFLSGYLWLNLAKN